MIWNRSAEAIFGHSSQEAIGKLYDHPVVPQERPQVQSLQHPQPMIPGLFVGPTQPKTSLSHPAPLPPYLTPPSRGTMGCPEALEMRPCRSGQVSASNARFEPLCMPARLMGNREAYHARTKAVLARLRSRSPRGAGDWNRPHRTARIELLIPVDERPRRTGKGILRAKTALANVHQSRASAHRRAKAA